MLLIQFCLLKKGGHEMKVYEKPLMSVLGKIDFPALAQSGAFIFLITPNTTDCCEDQLPENCEFPLGVPLPGNIQVSDGHITLVIGDVDHGCPTTAPIDSNGNFTLDLSECFQSNNSCEDPGQQSNGCCPRIAETAVLVGTFIDNHLEGTIVHTEDVPEGDPDCTGINHNDCSDSADVVADPA